MCENSRLRVIHISIAVAVIFLALQVACAVNGGFLKPTGVWLFGSVVRLAGLTPFELPPPSPASSDGSTGMVPIAGDRDGADRWRSWLCR